MPLFDPGAVNRQIDAYLASVPPGKRLALVGNANLNTKTASVALMVRVSDHFGAYVRVGKTVGGQVEADTGFKASFLVESGQPVPVFSYPELVAVLKDRGLGWIRSHLYAYKLMRGEAVEL